MEIKTDFTIDEFSRSNYESKKAYIIGLIIISIISFILFVPCFIMLMNSDDSLWSLFTGVSAFLFIFPLIMIFIIRPNGFKKRLIKINPTLANGIFYTYIFNEQEVLVTEKLSSSESINKINYSMIIKVKITNNFMYLYINKFQAFPIKKTDINEEEMAKLKEIFKDKIK